MRGDTIPIHLGCNINQKKVEGKDYALAQYWHSDFYQISVSRMSEVSPLIIELLNEPQSTDEMVKTHSEDPDDVNALLDARGFSFIRKDYPVQVSGLSQVGTVEALLKKKMFCL